jgi:hypothetical protein
MCVIIQMMLRQSTISNYVTDGVGFYHWKMDSSYHNVTGIGVINSFGYKSGGMNMLTSVGQLRQTLCEMGMLYEGDYNAFVTNRNTNCCKVHVSYNGRDHGCTILHVHVNDTHRMYECVF